MNPLKVCFTAGDGIGWAVDEDLRLIVRAAEGIVEPTSIGDCEVVHALWWWGLLGIPREMFLGKLVLCHFSGEPFRFMTVPQGLAAMDRVDVWVARTEQARRQAASIGLSAPVVPYLVDDGIFKPLDWSSEERSAFRRELGIPGDAYCIGSFQRDSEGADLAGPKLAKGPDVFAEIIATVERAGRQVHAVLGGPRRHWLLKRLRELDTPFTYVGTPTDRDDLAVNTLPRPFLNRLYNAIDLCLVASRSEGGPHAILEASAAGCATLSSRVGAAEDILEPTCVFDAPDRAVDAILRDIAGRTIRDCSTAHRRRIEGRHVPSAAAPALRFLYAACSERRDEQKSTRTRGSSRRSGSRGSAAISADSRSAKEKPTIGLWHTFYNPPYGGGNQFMLALKDAWTRQGLTVAENRIGSDIDAYVLNSIHFDVDRFRELSRDGRLKMLHRIDGPISLIRGFDREKDELCFELNASLASATVIQSAWTLRRIHEMGYRPKDPVIVHNAVNPAVFHSRGRIPFDRRRKIRVISTSWSDNPRKGGPIYKQLERVLDWDRFEYTFVGNLSESLDRARHLPPVPSDELARILRSHDIYITASANDPCSNALIEALACGLPALYPDDGGHPELAQYGGLAFSDEREIPALLERLVDGYEMFQALISVPTIKDVADRYLELIRRILR